MKIWALLLLLPATAFAGQWSLEIPFASHHFDRSVDWNERNPGVGASYWNKENTYYAAGCYENSVSNLVFEGRREVSCYLVRGVELGRTFVRGGIDLGFMTNLPPSGPGRDDGYSVAPMAAPYIKAGTDSVSIKAYAVPIENRGFVGFQMSWRL